MKNKVKISKFSFILASLVFVAYFIMSIVLTSNIFASTSFVMWKNNLNSSMTSLPVYGNGYAIKTSQDLAYWSAYYSSYKNSTITLTSSIDMSKIGSSIAYFTPIAEFNGTFNGNGFSISGLNIYSTNGYAGLFGKTNGATIKNLNLLNTKVYNTGEYLYNNGAFKFAHVGLIVSCASSGSIIKCCVNNEKISPINFKLTESTTHLWFGGIVGRITSSMTISACFAYGNYNFDSIYNGKILNWAAFGGIAGEILGTDIQTCESNTSISGVKNISEVCGGGIVGKISSSSRASKITESCNYGNVSVGDSTNTNIAYCGGIVGQSVASPTIQYCFNVGNISAYGNGNSYEVIDTFASDSQEYAFTEKSFKIGGFIGIGATTYTFKKTQNFSGGIRRDKIYVGGLVGYLNTDSTVKYCYNSGTVLSNSNKYIWDNVKVDLYNGNSVYDSLNTTPKLCWNVQNVLMGNEGTFSKCSNIYDSNIANYQANSFKYGGSSTSTIYASWKSGQALVDHEAWGTVSSINTSYTVSVGYELAKSFSSAQYCMSFSRSYEDISFEFISPTSSNISDITTVASSKFMIEEGVNNGKPILKKIYWENSTITPASVTK